VGERKGGMPPRRKKARKGRRMKMIPMYMWLMRGSNSKQMSRQLQKILKVLWEIEVAVE